MTLAFLQPKRDTHRFPHSAAVPVPGRMLSWPVADGWRAAKESATASLVASRRGGRPYQQEGTMHAARGEAGADRARLRTRSRTKVAASGLLGCSALGPAKNADVDTRRAQILNWPLAALHL